MNFYDFQQLAMRTSDQDQPPSMRRSIAGLGLCGEAGEVVEIIKKEVGHAHPPAPEKIAAELGDVLWYCAEVADAYCLSLEVIAEGVIAKLRKRYPEGFSSEASMARVDV